MQRTFNRATTWYTYDGKKPFQESGATVATNVYGLGIDENIFIRITRGA